MRGNVDCALLGCTVSTGCSKDRVWQAFIVMQEPLVRTTPQRFVRRGFIASWGPERLPYVLSANSDLVRAGFLRPIVRRVWPGSIA